jgi:hypothetical protein
MTREEFESKGAAYKMVMILDALDKGIDLSNYSVEEDVIETEDIEVEVLETDSSCSE